jgi:mycofactocin system glycosyltransferase
VSAVPLPVGFGVRLDPRTRELDPRTLAGGAPVRVLRLSPRGAAAWAELVDGTVRSRAGGLLARRVTDAGLGHPVPPAASTLDATVIVPVRDRPAVLDRCLQGLGRRHPVVVVDDASSDPAAVAAVAHRHGATVLRRDTNGGPGAARNTGLAAVRSEIVVFVDSDCEPAGDWVEELAAHLADPLVAAAAPRIVAAPGDEPSVRYARSRGALDLGPRPASVSPGTRVAYVPTAALVARRGALVAVARGHDVFDPALRHGEDVDLVWRLHEAGFRVRYDPAVSVAHAEPRTWRALLARRFRYGTSAAPLSGRHPGALAPLLLEPWTGAAVAALLLRRPVVAAVALGGALADERAARRGAGLARAGATAAVLGRAARTARATGTYATQFLTPALVAGLTRPSARGSAAALLLAPPLASWWSRRTERPGVTFLLGHVAEDLAYGTGVLRGCVRQRTATPLRPVLVRRSRPERPVPEKRSP